jgi:glycosyltransferase involved in cell wall biosynthesis
MKIVNFSAYDKPQSASTRSYDILRGLSKLGYDVFLVTNNFCLFEKRFTDSVSVFIDGVQCDYLSTPGYNSNVGRLWNSLVNFWKILRYKKISDLDVVIGPSVPITTGFAAYLYAKSVGAKFVFEVRDVWPIALVMLGGISKLNPIYWIYRWIEIFLYKHSDLIVSALPSIDKHVSDVNPRGVVFHIPNPISNDLIIPDINPKIFCKSHKKIPVITYIGGFGLVHDTETLILAAIHYINRIDSEVEFNFYGNGIKWDAANSLINSLGLSDKIKLHGFIAKNVALSKAKNSDVLIAAVPDSAIFEFGINLNKLYLYIAAGVPIAFAGNIPFNIVSDNNFGVSVGAEKHVELANGICQLINADPEFRRDLKERMRFYAENFLSESAITSRYQNLFLNIML